MLILADLTLDFPIETELFFQHTRHPDLGRWILIDMSFRECPVTEHVVHEREIVLPVVLGIRDSSRHFLERQFFTLYFLFALFVLAWFAELLIDGTEDTIHEPA